MLVSHPTKLASNGIKLNSPLTHDGFYDDDSSSSDDQYLYSRSDFDSDSSDSEVDQRRNRGDRLVFINGRQITPKVNTTRGKGKQGSDCETYSPDKNAPRPTTTTTRRIRFAQDGEDRIHPLIMREKNAGNDAKSRTAMTVTIRNTESRASNQIKASRINAPPSDKVSNGGKGEVRVVSSPQKSVAKIKIQGKEATNDDNSKAMRITTGTHEDEREFGQLKRSDSGILPGSSSSVSQGTADSFDKEDGSKVEAGSSCDREVPTATFKYKRNSNIKSRLESRRELEIDCTRSQLDSGFEDPGRFSPGGFSPKENRLKQVTNKTLSDSFNEYPNALRQASLRVFGLVGRKVKAFEEAASKVNVNEIVRNGRVHSKGWAVTQNKDTRCKNAFVSRLEDIYRANLPSNTEISARDSVEPVKQPDNVAEEEEEEEWPDPPSFDDDVNEEEGTEITNEPECLESQGRNEQSILEGMKVFNQGSVSEKCSIDAHSLDENQQHATVVKQKRHDPEHMNRGDNNPQYSRLEAFEKSRMRSGMDFEAFGEGRRTNWDTLASWSCADSYLRGERSHNRVAITDFEQQRVSEFESRPISVKSIQDGRKIEDECTVCEVLSNEKGALRRSADMESFRKTTLNDCDSVMKKMKHAQEISRKISGSESPRRASMRKSKTDRSISSSSSSAEGLMTQLNYATGERSGKLNSEFVDNGVNVDAGPAHYKESSLQADPNSAAKGAHTLSHRNELGNDDDIYKSLTGQRDGFVNTNNVTKTAGINALSRQCYMEQFDAKGFFMQQFEREKSRQKVKRHLSEDFLIVDAMPCLHQQEPRRYDKARHHVSSPQSVLPHYHLMPHFEPRCDAARDEPRFSSDPHQDASFDKNQGHWLGSFPRKERAIRDSSKSAYQGGQGNCLPASPIDSSKFEPMSGMAQNEDSLCRPSPHSTPYFQGKTSEKANTDPFRTEREKSWFKRTARRLRRSLSFEDNSRKRPEKHTTSEPLPIRPCNSSGNIKDEYESYLVREERGRLLLRSGVSHRHARSSSNGKEQHYKNDPNFHPKYGFIANDLSWQQKSNIESVNPKCTDANGNHPCDAANFVVQHNMYFGNNPSTPNARMLGRNGTNLGHGHLSGSAVVQPLPVRKPSQKTAKTKSLQFKK